MLLMLTTMIALLLLYHLKVTLSFTCVHLISQQQQQSHMFGASTVIHFKLLNEMEVNVPLVSSIILPNVGGWLGALITKPNIKTWYEHLVRPAWRPPNWAFAPVWTSLYCSMGYASYRVYTAGGGFQGPARIPLTLYASQLALNWAWTPIFFGWKKLGLSLVEILVLYANIVACTSEFYRIDRTAGHLMLPYVCWTTLATALTYCIWRDNKTPRIKGK